MANPSLAAAPPRPRRKRQRSFTTERRPGFLVYGILLAFFLGSTYPLWYSLVIGSSDPGVFASAWPPLLPGGQFWHNVAEVFNTVDFWAALGNSLVVSSVITLSVVSFSTLAGYAFAKLRFRGREGLLVFVIATLAILSLFTFMTAWTDYLWPMLVAPQNPTLQVALSQLQSARYVDYTIVMAGALMATIPLLVLFVVAGRQLVSGIMAGAVKG